MRIVILNTAASKTGALSILKDFYEYIKENDKENEYVFIVSDNYIEETGNIKVIVRDDIKKSRVKRLKFDKFEGAKFIESLKPDVFFSMQNTAPSGYKGRTVLYVHQPLGFQKAKNFSFFKSNEREYAIYQHIICKMIDKSIKKADKVIVQTRWMRDAIIKKTGISKEKIVNIIPDVTVPEKFLKLVNSNDLVSGKNEAVTTFFYPSGNILYKNHDVLIKAASILKREGITDFKIEITLKREDLIGKADMELVDDLGTLISFNGSMDRDDVFTTYLKSILVFPSYIETFGYPLMEARVLERSIIASDEPFCREILDGYSKAEYFSSFNEKELAVLMKKMINSSKTFDKSDNNFIETNEERVINNNQNIGTNNSDNKGNSWGYVIKEIQSV